MIIDLLKQALEHNKGVGCVVLVDIASVIAMVSKTAKRATVTLKGEETIKIFVYLIYCKLETFYERETHQLQIIYTKIN